MNQVRIKADWTLGPTTSSANTAVALTKAAVPGFRHYLSSVTAVISGAAVGTGGAAIQCFTGSATSTETYRFSIPAATAVGGTVHYTLDTPIPISSFGAAAVVQAAACGTSSICTLSAAGITDV